MHGQVVPVHALECVGIEIEVLRQALLECDLTFTGGFMLGQGDLTAQISIK